MRPEVRSRGGPRLASVVGAYTVNRLGTAFGVLAVSLSVYDHTHHSPAAVAAAFVAPMLPALLTPAVVARVEASRRRGTLGGLLALEALLAAGLAALLWHFWLPGVLVLVGLDGGIAYAANALMRSEAAGARSQPAPAGSAEGSREPAGSLPHEAADEAGRRRDMHKANAWLNIGFALSGIAGYALGGVTVSSLGGPAALLIDAASFLAAGALLAGARPFVAETEPSVRARLAAARAHLRAVPALRALMVVEAVAFVFFTCALPVEVAYAKSSLHAGDAGYGALAAVWLVGMLAGSVIFARAGGSPRAGGLRRGRQASEDPLDRLAAETASASASDAGLDAPRTGPWASRPGPDAGGRSPAERRLWTMAWAGALAVGVAYVGLAGAPSLGLACVAAIVGGLGNGVQWAAVLGTIQALSPARLLGRMMGAAEALGTVAPLVGFIVGGVLWGVSSPRAALLVAGIGASAAALALRGIAQLPSAGTEPRLAAPAVPTDAATATPGRPVHARAARTWQRFARVRVRGAPARAAHGEPPLTPAARD